MQDHVNSMLRKHTNSLKRICVLYLVSQMKLFILMKRGNDMNLQEFFTLNKKVAIAFSGGVDST